VGCSWPPWRTEPGDGLGGGTQLEGPHWQSPGKRQAQAAQLTPRSSPPVPRQCRGYEIVLCHPRMFELTSRKTRYRVPEIQSGVQCPCRLGMARRYFPHAVGRSSDPLQTPAVVGGSLFSSRRPFRSIGVLVHVILRKCAAKNRRYLVGLDAILLQLL